MNSDAEQAEVMRGWGTEICVFLLLVSNHTKQSFVIGGI
jgi:hypothetical protein